MRTVFLIPPRLPVKAALAKLDPNPPFNRDLSERR
jgi:hypothetical protein